MEKILANAFSCEANFYPKDIFFIESSEMDDSTFLLDWEQDCLGTCSQARLLTIQQLGCSSEHRRTFNKIFFSL